MEILSGLETVEGFALQAGLSIFLLLALITWIGGVLYHMATQEVKERVEEEIPIELRKVA